MGFLLACLFPAACCTWRATPARALRLFGRYEDELLEDIRYPAVVVTLSMYYCKLLLDSPLCEARQCAARVAARLPTTSVTPVIQCYVRARAEADPSPAAAMLLDEALDGFRQYGLADNLVHALLARSSLSRQRRDWPRAEADVREAFQVATTAALRLREIDVRLKKYDFLRLEHVRPGFVRKHSTNSWW